MKKQTRTLILIITSIMALLMLVFFAIDLRSNQKLDLQTVSIAKNDIKPRTRISDEDLVEIELPNSYLLENVVKDKNDIVGKYTEIQGMIPAGSFIFDTMIYDRDDLPDYPECELRKNQAAYTLEIDLAKLGGTLVANQRVDLYVSLKKTDQSTISDCLIQNARLISIKDHQGLDIDDEHSTKTPYLAILAINRDDIKHLAKADELGTIRLFSTDQTYDSKNEAELRKDTELFLELSRQ